MTLRVIHTSDWHLGHSLHDVSRTDEHNAFLAWLLDAIEEHQVDSLLIAGDIFDVANPSSSAQRQWYGFLSAARERFATLDIVAIGGNHDSAPRLEAPIDLLEALRIQVVGRLPRTETGQLDTDRLLCPLRNSNSQVEAWCVAVPFLRPTDLPSCPDADDGLIEGVRQVYAAAIAAGESRREPGQALLAMGHCYMVSGDISQLSERKILGGNQHALPTDIFADAVDYVALGHLHLAHPVGGKEHVRYSGSPLPLSMSEVNYPHQVRLVTFEGGRLEASQSLAIPRVVDLLRVPKDEPAPLDDVLGLLRELPPEDESPKPYLDVRVRLQSPQSGLRQTISEAIEGKQARLVKLTVEYAGKGEGLADIKPRRQLQDIKVEEVFRTLHESKHDTEPSDELIGCFRELVEQAQHVGGEA